MIKLYLSLTRCRIASNKMISSTNYSPQECLSMFFKNMILTYDLLGRLQNSYKFQNKKKELQGCYRRFQVQMQKWDISDTNKNNDKCSSAFDANQNINQSAKQNYLGSFDTFTILYYNNIVEKMKRSIEMEKLMNSPRTEFRTNPYIRRFKNYETNRKNRQKIDMTQFIKSEH